VGSPSDKRQTTDPKKKKPREAQRDTKNTEKKQRLGISGKGKPVRAPLSFVKKKPKRERGGKGNVD